MKRFVPLLLAGCCLLPSQIKSAENSNPFAPPNFPLPKFKDATFDVKSFGAVGDGVANDTAAIDKAIEKCSSTGGGTVTFPAGKYGAGSIHLKSNVRLQLDPNATIFGLAGAFEPPEPNLQFGKYQDGGHSHFHDSLFYGENIENVAIIGGKINGGNGAIGHGDPKPGSNNGDKLITVKVGRNLDFENITHEKGGHFCYLLNDCQGVTLNHIVIKESRDAVDLMGCSNVQIHDCNFTGCGDDTIGVKSDYALGRRINSANIYVWDSYFESGCNGLQFGSETAGDFRNCNFWNIRIGKANKAGIGITSGDSAVIDGVNYSNIVVKGAACPIYFLTWDRMRTGQPGAKVGAIKNVHLMNVTITDCTGNITTQPSVISGWASSPFENITLENVKIVYKGGESNAMANVIPPNPKDYSPRSFGPRPASGFYIRNGKGLTLKNVEISFENPDSRTSIAINNVDGLTFHELKSAKPAPDAALLKLENVKGITVRNSPGLKDRKAVAVENESE